MRHGHAFDAVKAFRAQPESMEKAMLGSLIGACVPQKQPGGCCPIISYSHSCNYNTPFIVKSRRYNNRQCS